MESKNLASKLPPLWRVAPPGNHESGKPSGPVSQTISTAREDLPYRVELWDHSGVSVEQVLAATASAGIGFGAYYQATQEFPDRAITLRHKNSVIARWTARKN